MIHQARAGLLAIGLALVAACWYGAACYPAAWPLWILAGAGTVGLLLAGLHAVADLWEDIGARRAERWRTLAQVGILPAEVVEEKGRGWVWIDYDGDGEIDAGEIVDDPPPGPAIHHWQDADADPAAIEARRNRLRALLIWCYRRQEAGKDWDQGPGRKEWRGTYDEDMNELTRLRFIRGRATGHRGDLWYTRLAEALERFDDGN